MRALNLSFGGLNDDRPYLQVLCDALGVDPLRVHPRDCGDVLREALVIDRAPISEPVASAYIAMARMHRARGGSLLLTGSAGDAIFGGDLRIFAHRASHGRVWSSVRGALRLKAWGTTGPRLRVDALIVRPILKGLLPAAVRRRALTANRLRRAPAWMGRRLRELFVQGAFEPDVVPDVGSPHERSWLDALSTSGAYLDYSEVRAQLELAGGCPRADPFLDPDLVEFLASLRPELLFHGDWVRGLFRHALGGLIPDRVRFRTDKAWFPSAFHELVEGAGGYATLEPLARVTGLADLGLVEPRRFRERFDQLVRTPLNGSLWMEIWPVLVAEAFVRNVGAA